MSFRIVHRPTVPVIRPEYADVDEAIAALRHIRQQNPGQAFDLVEVSTDGEPPKTLTVRDVDTPA